LNTLGYLDLRGPGGKYEDSVNLGKWDLVVALEWVRDNIVTFGGNPDRVTIDGQSGGGGKVSTLMAMPSAAGLFDGAIVQSGSTLRIGEGEETRAQGLAFARALGVMPDDAEHLDDFTYEELVAATRRAGDSMENGGGRFGRIFLGPTVDGTYIVQHLFDPTPAEFSKNVPMIIGSNLNEFTYANRAVITPLSTDEVRATLAERYGVKNGDPNTPELPEWAPYTPDEGATMIFDNESEVRYNHDQALVELAASLQGGGRQERTGSENKFCVRPRFLGDLPGVSGIRTSRSRM